MSATELAITVPGPVASVAVTAQAGRAPSSLGAPVVVTGGGSTLTIQALPGQSVHGWWVKDVSGSPAEPAAATVFTPHGARVVRSVAAIPGWTATWDPQDGPSVTLAVAVILTGLLLAARRAT